MLLSKERFKITSRINEEVLPDIQHQRGNEIFLFEQNIETQRVLNENHLLAQTLMLTIQLK